RHVPGPWRGPHEPRLPHGGAPVPALRRRGPDQQEPVPGLPRRGPAARRARAEREDPTRHRRRHAAARVRRGVGRRQRRPRGRPLRPRTDPRARDLHASRHRSPVRPAGVVHPARPRRRGRGARPQRHRDAEDRRRQPASPGAPPARQGHAAPARARARRRLLSPAARGAAEAQRQAARGAGGVRGGLQGAAARSARQRVHRKNEEAPGLSMSSRYWELTVAVSPDASEGLTNFVWELGALGVVEEENAAGRARLRAFFPEAADSDAIARSIDLYLGALESLGFARAGGPAVADVADTDWADAWRAHFAPLPIGRRFLVAPPWETPPPANGRLVLTLEPGRAFGTGQHATTAGCLELLETIVERVRPTRAIDLGTGSGILAIAAARLGVPDVLAIDSDPDAVASATANVERNGLGAHVTCEGADAAALDAEPVVASDGAGHDYTVRLDAVRPRATGAVVGVAEAAGESPLAVTLVQGLPKGDKLETIVRAATELGVARVVPAVAARTVVRLTDGQAAARLARWGDLGTQT